MFSTSEIKLGGLTERLELETVSMFSKNLESISGKKKSHKSFCNRTFERDPSFWTKFNFVSSFRLGIPGLGANQQHANMHMRFKGGRRR